MLITVENSCSFGRHWKFIFNCCLGNSHSYCCSHCFALYAKIAVKVFTLDFKNFPGRTRPWSRHLGNSIDFCFRVITMTLWRKVLSGFARSKSLFQVLKFKRISNNQS